MVEAKLKKDISWPMKMICNSNLLTTDKVLIGTATLSHFVLPGAVAELSTSDRDHMASIA